MQEIWKDIKGYEGKYMVSNLGRVKALYAHHEKILKQYPDEDGYLQLALSKHSKQKWFRVHRLVATTFIPNELDLPWVNHKDEDKSNNRVDNLEWCTPRYNNTYGTAQVKRAITLYNKFVGGSGLNKNSTRYFSSRQEKGVAKAVKGRTVANSGATPFYKGDVTTDDFLIECKTKMSNSNSISIKKEWMDKLEEEAFAMGKNYFALCFDFGPRDNMRYYIVTEREFQLLQEAIKDEQNAGY